jgi:hypothetical protein
MATPPVRLLSLPRPARGRRGSTATRLAVALLVLLAFMAATNRYVSTHEDIYVLHQSDSLSYRAMGGAAPRLLHGAIDEWLAERFAVHWVVGSAAKLFGVPLTAAYFVAVAIVILALCLVLFDLFGRVGLSSRGGAVCTALLILNPYSLRGFLVTPAGVADLVFMLGSAIAVRGLVLRAPAAVLGGLVLAATARQTAVPAAIVAALVIAGDSSWRMRLRGRRLGVALTTAVVPVACYAAIRIVAHPFSGPSPSLHTMTLLGASPSLHVLGQHFARCAIVIVGVVALMVATWWVLRSDQLASPEAGYRRDNDTSSLMFACLAFGAAIIVQPVVLNPVWAANNENRLTALGLVPLIVAVGILIRELERTRGEAISKPTTAAVLGLLALGSFHHFYTWLRLASAGQTVALQLVVAAVIVVVFSTERAREFDRRSPD